MRCAADDQPGEHGGHEAVDGRVADVLLVRLVGRRIDRELVRLRVVGRRRLPVLHIGAVGGHGHREAAGELERGDLAQEALVVARWPR